MAGFLIRVLLGCSAGLVLVVSSPRAESFRIGLTLGLTGEYAELARMHERAYRLWEAEVNERGGLLGKQVEIIVVDDRSERSEAEKAYRAMLSERRVDLVLGPYSSALTAAVAPIVEKFDYPMLTPGAASDRLWKQGYRNALGMLPPASRYGVGMLELALLNDLKTVAIVHAEDEFSIEAANGSRTYASVLGLEIVAFERLANGTGDLDRLAEQARSAGAELLLLAGHFKEAVEMQRALGRIGWDPRAYFATIGPALPQYYDELGTEAEGTFATSLWEYDVRFPGSREFAESFQRQYAVTPSYHAAAAYAAGQVLEAAVGVARSLERDRIRDALYDLDIYTIIGRYAVDRTGMQVKRFPLIVQWQNHQKEIVWPEEAQSAKPIFQP